MNKVLFLMLGIAGTLYVKDKDFRNECNKAIEGIINNIKEQVK